MKYVIFQRGDCYHPVIFADHTSHKQVSLKGCHPISAGFLKLSSLGIPTCYGRSESLNLESRGDLDADLIRKMQIDCNMTSFMI